VHPVRRRDLVAFADPAFATHVHPRRSIAPDDDHGETRQALRKSRFADEALKTPGGLGTLLLQSGYSAAGEQNHR
jgi:hypothetical protein